MAEIEVSVGFTHLTIPLDEFGRRLGNIPVRNERAENGLLRGIVTGEEFPTAVTTNDQKLTRR